MTGEPLSVNRRAFLAAGAVSIGSTFGGCLGGGASEPTRTQGLQLPSLDVAGSPGGPVPVRPPGTVVLLDFFATWCAPCKPEMANLRAARARFSPDRVHLLSITQETDESAIERFWRRYDGTWPVATDPDLEATQRYDVVGVPTIIVLTPDGVEVMRHRGLAGEAKIVSNLEAALEQSGLG
jgi:thiol-disulfide isomerase/thioredoxin